MRKGVEERGFGRLCRLVGEEEELVLDFCLGVGSGVMFRVLFLLF